MESSIRRVIVTIWSSWRVGLLAARFISHNNILGEARGTSSTHRVLVGRVNIKIS